MEKFTKEQTPLFTVIACIVMLLAFFLVSMGGVTPFEALKEGYVGWFGIILLIVDMLVPVYLCIYAYRDQKALEPLKPILGISPKLAYSLPLIAVGVTLLSYFMFMAESWSVILYFAAACCAFFIFKNSAE